MIGSSDVLVRFLFVSGYTKSCDIAKRHLPRCRSFHVIWFIISVTEVLEILGNMPHMDPEDLAIVFVAEHLFRNLLLVYVAEIGNDITDENNKTKTLKCLLFEPSKVRIRSVALN
jgi:hypothetical protein